MPADILVSGTSAISFSSSYHPYQQQSHVYHEPPSLLTLSTPRNILSAPLDFPTALGSSPPVLSASPPTHFTFHGRCSSPTLRPVPVPPPVPTVTLARNLQALRLETTATEMPVAVPRRPCLVVRCEDMLELSNSNRHKKRVVFADDRGFPLTLVRTMTEPSSMPPRWSFQFLAQVTQGASAEVATEPWEVVFSQPASDYLDFRKRLDTQNVSLENVIVKESEQVVIGTVKVRNIAFHKEVFVRTSHDNWKTHEDAFCAFVPNSPPAHGVTVLYDTFSFRLTLPPRSRRLEFCVCYRCSGVEFWDNNGGKNYQVVKKEPPVTITTAQRQIPLEPVPLPKYQTTILSRKFSDDVKPDVQIDSWSEFASWNHLANDTPYW